MNAYRKDKRTTTELDTWFAECSARAKTFAAARELWLSVWNETDRINLGGDLEAAFNDHGGTVGMWEHCRAAGESNLAILQINQILNSYPENRINKMIEALGYSINVVYSEKPNWEASRGMLFFEGKCVRTVRSYKKLSNVQKVLALFQEEGWPRCAEVSKILDTLNTNDTVDSLNTNLEILHFSSRSGGSEICWKNAELPLHSP